MKLFMKEDTNLILDGFEFSQAGLIGPHLDNEAMEMLKVIQERFKMT